MIVIGSTVTQRDATAVAKCMGCGRTLWLSPQEWPLASYTVTCPICGFSELKTVYDPD